MTTLRTLTRLRPLRRDLPPRGTAGPLRCQFLITSMPVGGAETLLVNLLRRFNPARIAPEVVCLKSPGPLGETIADQFPLHSGLLRGKLDPLVLPRLVRLMRRRRVDAVVTVGAGDKMFWGRLAAWSAGVPVIASALHSTGWPDGVGRLNRLLTPLTDAFIAVAESHGEFLRDFERFPAPKVHVIRNGVDCARFRPDPPARASVRDELGLTAETPLVGIVAALRPEKHHTMLIDAAARLRDRPDPPHFLIVGDGPERQRIRTHARSLGVEDRVHLLGTRHDTPRLLAALDVFTLCSLNEASPVSILEALACEIPVVATDVGSVSESVLPGETGRLVPRENVPAFADAIDDLLDDPATRNRMGAHGRSRVLQSGSLESMVDGYQRLIAELYDHRHAAVSKPPGATRGRPTRARRRTASAE